MSREAAEQRKEALRRQGGVLKSTEKAAEQLRVA
jgi:hypothetical protein